MIAAFGFQRARHIARYPQIPHSPSPMIYCPTCAVAVADVAASGRSEGVCPKCRYRYGAITGRVAQSYTKQIPHVSATRTRLACELRIDRPDGTRAMVEFRIPGGEDQVNVRQGDSVTVVYTMRGDAFEAVVSITNNTTRTSYDIARPDGGSKAKAAVWGAALAMVALPWATAAVAPALTALIVATAGIGCYFVIERATSLRVKRGSPAAASAGRDAGFLEKKQELLALRDEQLDSSRHNEGLRTRLVSLIGKMRSVGDELYASRIKQAQAAIDILDQLISLDEASLDEYAKTITMIEIEQESLAVTESMTDEAAGMLAERLATLDEVLEQNADLRLQLEANEEVQRLLS